MKNRPVSAFPVVGLCVAQALFVAMAWGGNPNTLQLSDTVRGDDLTYSGRWSWEGFPKKRSRELPNQWIQIELVQDHGNRYWGGIPAGEFKWKQAPGAEAEKDELALHFGLSRPAGEMSFSGQPGRKGAAGRFEFKADKTYAEEVARLCGGHPDVEDLFQLALCQGTIEQLKAFKATGLSLSVTEWIRCLHSGVAPDFASGMYQALGRATIEELIQCRNSGLNVDSVRAFRKAGYAWDYRNLIRARNSGVQPDYAAELKKAGFDLPLDEIIRLRNSGVPTGFAARVRELGFAGLEEIIHLRNSGVSEDYLREIHEADARYSIAEIIRLRNSGVPTSYVKVVKKAGYPFNPDEIIRLRNSGVSEAFLQQILVPNRKPLSVETIINLRNRGISAETIRELRQ